MTDLPVHEGHPGSLTCPNLHYWPHLGDTAEDNWTNRKGPKPVTKECTYAKVIADSISGAGHRVTTMEVRFHRFVLAEFNTHRRFSRNSASSRAIPLRKQAERVIEDMAYPLEWPAEQKGMQGGEPLSARAQEQALLQWGMAGFDAVKYASGLHALGWEADERLHKSLANRLLEPFMWHTVVVTSTEWENFFEQRCSPLAQPEIRVAAEMMRDALAASKPEMLTVGEWHLPYVTDVDLQIIMANADLTLTPQEVARATWAIGAKVSTARCARVSYLTQDGKRDLNEDLGLYQRLVSATPWHGSPAEHPCTPWAQNAVRQAMSFEDVGGQIQRIERVSPRFGNLLGWRQLRLEIEATLTNESKDA